MAELLKEDGASTESHQLVEVTLTETHAEDRALHKLFEA
jgi:hypothetical protein